MKSINQSITHQSHINESWTLHLINGISNDLQKLFKCFSSTAIAPFLFSAIRLDLYLNDEKLFGIWLPSTANLRFPSISSLLNCYKLPEVSE